MEVMTTTADMAKMGEEHMARRREGHRMADLTTTPGVVDHLDQLGQEEAHRVACKETCTAPAMAPILDQAGMRMALIRMGDLQAIVREHLMQGEDRLLELTRDDHIHLWIHVEKDHQVEDHMMGEDPGEIREEIHVGLHLLICVTLDVRILITTVDPRVVHRLVRDVQSMGDLRLERDHLLDQQLKMAMVQVVHLLVLDILVLCHQDQVQRLVNDRISGIVQCPHLKHSSVLVRMGSLCLSDLVCNRMDCLDNLIDRHLFDNMTTMPHRTRALGQSLRTKRHLRLRKTSFHACDRLLCQDRGMAERS